MRYSKEIIMLGSDPRMDLDEKTKRVKELIDELLTGIELMLEVTERVVIDVVSALV